MFLSAFHGKKISRKFGFKQNVKIKPENVYGNSETLLLKKKSAEMKTVTYSKSTNN